MRELIFNDYGLKHKEKPGEVEHIDLAVEVPRGDCLENFSIGSMELRTYLGTNTFLDYLSRIHRCSKQRVGEYLLTRNSDNDAQFTSVWESSHSISRFDNSFLQGIVCAHPNVIKGNSAPRVFEEELRRRIELTLLREATQVLKVPLFYCFPITTAWQIANESFGVDQETAHYVRILENELGFNPICDYRTQFGIEGRLYVHNKQ